MTRVILMRGVPGAGKTTYRREHYPDAWAIETDAHLTDADGTWRWQPERLRRIYALMHQELLAALRARAPLVVIDRCHITLTSMRQTLRAARAAGADVRVVTLEVDALVAWERCVHGTPARDVSEMAARLQRESVPRWVEHDVLR